MSREELRVREEAAFGAFLRALREGRRPEGDEEGGTNGDHDGGDVAPFEHNLEVRGDAGRGRTDPEGTRGGGGLRDK